jgi:DNA helicase-2/ATP-dependent DNA helicase PcrA
VLNSPPRGIGATTIAKLEQEARKQGISLYKAIKLLLQADNLAAALKDKLSEFIKAVDGFGNRTYRNAAEMIKDIVESTGYLDDIEEERIQGILLLTTAAENTAVRDFLDRLSLLSAHDEIVPSHAVSLMPLHAARGLEFPVVFIVGVEEGIIPYFKSFDNPAEMQEERRLFYLGMTRAQDILCLSSVKRRRVYSKIQDQEPSRFMKDLPKDCCTWTERLPQKERKCTESLSIAPLKTAPMFIIGTRVKHPSWGVGIVRDCSGEGEEAKVTVNFPGVGIKRLAAKLANLERI